MGDPRELEWAKKPDALKESWTARNGTHVYTEFPLQIVHGTLLMNIFMTSTMPPTTSMTIFSTNLTPTLNTHDKELCLNTPSKFKGGHCKGNYQVGSGSAGR